MRKWKVNNRSAFSDGINCWPKKACSLETTEAYSSPGAIATLLLSVSRPLPCFKTNPRIQWAYGLLESVLLFTVRTPFTSVPRFEARIAPPAPAVLILLLLSLSHPGGGDDRPVRRLSQDDRRELAGWLPPHNERAGPVPSTILHIGRTVPMHTISPTNQSCFHGSCVCWQWPREW